MVISRIVRVSQSSARARKDLPQGVPRGTDLDHIQGARVAARALRGGLVQIREAARNLRAVRARVSDADTAIARARRTNSARRVEWIKSARETRRRAPRTLTTRPRRCDLAGLVAVSARGAVILDDRANIAMTRVGECGSRDEVGECGSRDEMVEPSGSSA